MYLTYGMVSLYSIQDYFYSAFYDTFVAQQLYMKVSTIDLYIVET